MAPSLRPVIAASPPLLDGNPFDFDLSSPSNVLDGFIASDATLRLTVGIGVPEPSSSMLVCLAWGAWLARPSRRIARRARTAGGR